MHVSSSSSKIFFIFIFIIFITQPYNAFAKTAVRGPQSPATRINWSVTSANSCSPSYDTSTYSAYPSNAGDQVFALWSGAGTTASGYKDFNQVWGNSALPFPQTYVFKCTDPGSGVSSSDTLVVYDCTSPQVWNNTSHSCVDPAASCGVVTKSW
ncbi:MAG: hypothetical protein ACAH17_00470, partial [Candidatus Paceibacterota bacterium]